MKRVAFLAAILVFVLAVPALAQDGGEFCAIPEGCDFDGDGVAETPAGESVPTESQYGPEEEFCAIPEGCGASASPDPVEGSSASPSPPATSAAPEEGEGSASASIPAEGGAAGASSAGGGQPRAGLTVLPETGGAPVTIPGLGAVLVACGILARRIFR